MPAPSKGQLGQMANSQFLDPRQNQNLAGFPAGAKPQQGVFGQQIMPGGWAPGMGQPRPRGLPMPQPGLQPQLQPGRGADINSLLRGAAQDRRQLLPGQGPPPGYSGQMQPQPYSPLIGRPQPLLGSQGPQAGSMAQPTGGQELTTPGFGGLQRLPAQGPPGQGGRGGVPGGGMQQPGLGPPPGGLGGGK